MTVNPGTETLSELRRAAGFEARRFRLPENWKDGRDLVWGVAIDDYGTRDRDDAIAIDAERGPKGEYAVAISIADVASFLTKETTPAVEAYAREMGETNYLGSHNKPMIPRPISEGILSIMPSQGENETPVLTVAIGVKPDGGAGGIRFSRERMRPAALTYADVARMRTNNGRIRGRPVQDYENLAWLLYDHRRRAGGTLPSDEDYLVSDLMSHKTKYPGEFIVREFMVLANTAVAKFMVDNNIPGLYRLHEGEFAWYSPEPGRHVGLQLEEAYAHFTSPLRRFADFVNHANIMAFLEGRDFPYQGDELLQIAEHINTQQEQARHKRLLKRTLGAEALHAVQAGDTPATLPAAA